MNNSFYEEDEPIEHVIAAFEAGSKGLTACTVGTPIHDELFEETYGPEQRRWSPFEVLLAVALVLGMVVAVVWGVA